MTDVVVAGAGPTGLALACGLRAAGIDVRVVDGAPAPATTSRALGLQSRGVEVLTRLGAAGGLAERGFPVREIAVTVDGRPLARLRIGAPTRLGGPAGLLLSQADIEGALRKRFTALGGRVEWDKRVTSVAQHDSNVTISLQDGTSVEAGWLVGADGAHSTVRKAAGIGFPGVPLVERFLIADVRAEVDRPRNAVSVWLRAGNMLAAFPLPGDHLWRLMAPADHVDVDEPEEIAEHLGSRLNAEAGGLIRTTEWISSFRIQRRLADTYRLGRVLLAGDAAHIHSPFGGQGMNTGIGDAENLAWKLALVVAGSADAALLDTYAAERRPIAEEVLSTTTGLTRIFFGSNRFATILRDRIAVPLLNRPTVQRLIAEKASQLHVTYRRGPLGGRGRQAPGDRIADQECTGLDGQATRLYTELGPAWVLMGSPELARAAASRPGEVVALNPAQSPALLIRPDGHLAWRGTDAASMHRWLDRTLGVAARREMLSV